jgi:hypothetical protein
MIRLPVPNPSEREGPGDNALGHLAFPVHGGSRRGRARAVSNKAKPRSQAPLGSTMPACTAAV